LDGKVRFTGPDAAQICNVLRMRKGDRLLALDGSGICYTAVICDIEKGYVSAAICGSSCPDTEPAVHLTLAQGLPKGDRFGRIVQEGTEVGISEFAGMLCARSVVRPSEASGRQARWQRIAKEASEQSGRSRVPEVREVSSFGDVLASIHEYDLALMAWEQESGRLLGDTLRKSREARRVMLLIGPEGGFTPEEAERARRAGAIPVSLGCRLLRSETAAIAASVIILNELEGHL